MAAPLTEGAIQRMREMIASGQLKPGARLASEAELANQLGASRNTIREAVRALVTARVLDVRRGDGTYVTSLGPELLLDGMSAAVELMQEGFSLELVAVRRILEPAVTALAATRMDPASLVELGNLLELMRAAESAAERVQRDVDFHRLVTAHCGNETLASMLNAVSSRTIRARTWRGQIDLGATSRTLVQHEDILSALIARDPGRAEAAALLHVATTEAWFRLTIDEGRHRSPDEAGRLPARSVDPTRRQPKAAHAPIADSALEGSLAPDD